MNKVSKENFKQDSYKHGFITEIENEKIPKGLNEEIVRIISQKKNEPQWMLDWRLKAFNRLEAMKKPDWANVKFDEIDFQDIYYYSSPKGFEDKPKSLDEVDPKLLETYEKLGIPLKEQEVLAGVAVDAVFDSVSVATTFKEKLNEMGVIFCPISEAIQKHPELVKKYLGSVIPITDHFYATLNSAVFSDGSFVYRLDRCLLENKYADTQPNSSWCDRPLPYRRTLLLFVWWLATTDGDRSYFPVRGLPVFQRLATA